MPWALPKPCTTPGCPNKQPCPIHAKPRNWGRDKRPPAQERGYDAGYRRQRAIALKRDRFTCQMCGQRATVTHHIVPLPEGTHDPSNLLSLCRSCHEKTHGREH